MPRLLKTYVTTSGFFELAVAAPSMKAAIEIWGASPDIFQRGYAKATDEPSIVKATMAKPGVVLKRNVGTSGAFKENPDPPKIPQTKKIAKAKVPPKPVPKPEPIKPETAKAKKADAAANEKAARLYEKAQKERERETTRAEAAERKVRERREWEARKAEAALEAARAEHDERITAIEQKIAEFERAAHDEDEQWKAVERRIGERLRKFQT